MNKGEFKCCLKFRLEKNLSIEIEIPGSQGFEISVKKSFKEEVNLKNDEMLAH